MSQHYTQTELAEVFRDRPAMRRIHNVCVTQARQGWRKADVLQALRDADEGRVYTKDDRNGQK